MIKKTTMITSTKPVKYKRQRKSISQVAFPNDLHTSVYVKIQIYSWQTGFDCNQIPNDKEISSVYGNNIRE